MPNYAYVACQTDGLTIIDVTDPASPTFRSNIQGAGPPNYLAGLTHIHVVGSYAYVTAFTDAALTIIDISDPANPTFRGSIQGAGAPNYLAGARAVFVLGSYAYVTGQLDDALSIFDISDPANPTLVGSIQGAGAPNYLNDAIGVHVVGGYAYVTAITDDALTIIDVSDPANPTFRGGIRGFGAPNYLNSPQSLFVVGNYAYVPAYLDDALSIFDISDPANPTLVGSIQGAGAPNWLDGAWAVYVVGNYAYVATNVLAGGNLTIIDVSDPANPSHVGVVGAGQNPYGVFVLGSYAYVPALVSDRLSIFDISDPANPTLAGSIQGAGAPNYLNGADEAFVVRGTTVTTQAATGLTTTSAVLNGTLVDDGGVNAACGFEWGPTPALGSTTPTQSLASGSPFSAALAGLSPGNTYYFRAFATNPAGTGYGALLAFTTTAAPAGTASVATQAATLVRENSARLNGMVLNDAGGLGEVAFDYGTTTAYGSKTAWQGGFGAGTAFLADIAGLSPGVAYHFRALFRRGSNLAYGQDMSFTAISPTQNPVFLSPELELILRDT